ncbi:MAG: Membrane protein involved in aromatic hydrocarbon degradation [uncultured bacterium]|nr:MAG: Membrane protein involved in aromatic hydrocarbon degradation [uncultured bacterium]
MKHIITALGALAVSSTLAQAGGFERSSVPLGFMFEKGSYAELTFGIVNPSVKGRAIGALGGAASGNVAKNYSQLGLAFKTDLNEKLSLGISLDPSFGADIAYRAATGFPIQGSTATLRGDTIALIGRYQFDSGFSALAGVRSVGVGGGVSLSRNMVIPSVGLVPVNGYKANFKTDRDLGYVVGVAYEKPEIALRVGLTYSTETTHELQTTGVFLNPLTGLPVAFTTPTTVELPKSVTFDFQSGVAANTLVFGSIRWMDWTATRLIAPNAGPANPLIDYDNDVITYSLGVGRKFNEQWSGAVSVSYEDSNGLLASNLSPTDGLFSLQVGGSYTRDKMKISGGVRYVKIGDASALGGGSHFEGNSAVAVGMKIGLSF